MLLHVRYGEFEIKLSGDEKKHSYRFVGPGVDVRGQFADEETWAEQIDARFTQLLADARGTGLLVVYANLREIFHSMGDSQYWSRYMDSPATERRTTNRKASK